MPDYWDWIYHGEQRRTFYVDTTANTLSPQSSYQANDDNYCSYQRIVFDAAGPALNPLAVDEQPNLEAQKFYDMIHAAEKELWPRNIKHSQLSAAVRMLDLKCTHQFSEIAYNDFSEFLQEVLLTTI